MTYHLTEKYYNLDDYGETVNSIQDLRDTLEQLIEVDCKFKQGKCDSDQTINLESITITTEAD